MADAPTAVERIDGWKEIARYLGRDVTTAIRWERQKGLPVHRVPGGRRQAVFAFAHEIDAWLRLDRHEVSPSPTMALVSAQGPAATAVADLPLAAEGSKAHAAADRSFASKNWIRSLAAAGALTLVLAGTTWLLTPNRIRLIGESQITKDGAIKTHLVTDGTNLYFGEWRDARIVVATVPVDGGEVREIQTPFVQTLPVGVSRDGRELLALVGEGQEKEMALWRIPLDGQAPRRLGNILCHAAAWSPNQRLIAYSLGNAVYLAGPDGQPLGKLRNFPAVPQEIRWSLDGRRLIVRIRDFSTWHSWVWELTLGRGDILRGQIIEPTLRPLVTMPRDYDSISPVLNGHDDFFLGTAGAPSTILTVRQSRLPWASNVSLERFAGQPTEGNDFALDPAKRKLYLLKDTAGRNELEQFDLSSHQFRPLLAGLSVRDVDFSHDGRQIAYVQEPDNTLWVAAANGGSARQIPTPGMVNIELPRWSPDDRQIAFLGKLDDKPYRVFVASADGGSLFQASHGTDNQGAPTWSPDGRELVYGRVLCQEEESCAIGEINLRTGEQKMIAGSAGLSTARWSPDGRFVAALRADRHQVWLLDRRSATWKRLSGGVNGNDLAWAPDSRSVYASSPDGNRPELLQISIENGKTQAVADLSEFSKLNGRVDTWFAVAPNDSFIFLRIIAGHEVYSLSYQ